LANSSKKRVSLMFEQENGCENAYLVSVYNVFINLSISVASKIYIYRSLVFFW